jgi:hypothetical protein
MPYARFRRVSEPAGVLPFFYPSLSAGADSPIRCFENAAAALSENEPRTTAQEPPELTAASLKRAPPAVPTLLPILFGYAAGAAVIS